MYEGFFGLNHAPFSLTPDTHRFVNLDSHRACFDVLTFAMGSNEGFVKLVGDVGTGKTLLCRKLLHYLEDTPQQTRFRSIYIPNPMLSALGLLRTIASALDIDRSRELRYADLFDGIQEQLLEDARQKRTAVILIDEAQALPADTLEALRLITNLETEDRKLVQIVLSGQPELDTVLHEHRFRQLLQRISFHAELEPMDLEDVAHYVNARMQTSGYDGPPVFTRPVARQLYRYSRGVPRLLNVLCHKALLSAYGRGQRRVTVIDVHRAAKDSPGVYRAKRRWAVWGLIPLSALALGLFALNVWGGLA